MRSNKASVKQHFINLLDIINHSNGHILAKCKLCKFFPVSC